MSVLNMTIAVGDLNHDVDYVVTHEACGPSGYGFDGSADAGEPLEFYIVTVDEKPAKDVEPALMEALESFIHENHEPDDGDDFFD